jgi:LDH2 family malate/lactate/ureidoglycolate dehydrogenase
LPGEPESRERSRREAAGIPIDETTWKKICNIELSKDVSIPEIHHEGHDEHEGIRERNP